MEIKLIIRNVTEKDIDQCAELFIKAFSPEPWGDKWEGPEQTAKYLRELFYNPVFWGTVVEGDKKIVGACFGNRKTWFSGDEYNIMEFFTDKDAAAKGIGTYMMNYIKQQLIEMNIHKVTLLTGRGFPAQRFYEKNGIYTDDGNVFMSGQF